MKKGKVIGSSNEALKIILWVVAIYHILLGLLGIFAKDFAVTLAKSFFNFNLTLTNQVYWIINPFAAYVLVFGIFIALAARDPIKYKNIIFVGIVLFAIRVVQRIIFFISAPEGLVSNVNPAGNIIMIIVALGIGVAMFFMVKKIK